jgi:hypothetical protein
MAMSYPKPHGVARGQNYSKLYVDVPSDVCGSSLFQLVERYGDKEAEDERSERIGRNFQPGIRDKRGRVYVQDISVYNNMDKVYPVRMD